MQVARRLVVSLLLALLTAVVTPVAAHAEPSAGPVKYYVVRSDWSGQPEFLFEIAQRFLGSGDRNNEIFELNKGRVQPDGLTMTKPEAILPGWVLQLPADAKGDGVQVGVLPKYAPPASASSPAPTATARVSAAAVAVDSTSGLGWLSWTLLIAGAVVLLGVIAVGYLLWRRDELPPLPRLGRRRAMPPPPFLSGQASAEQPAEDRFYYAGEEPPAARPSRATTAQSDRVPAFALAGVAILAVAALVAGVLFAVLGRNHADPQATASAGPPAAQDTLGPRIGSSDPSLCLAATTTNDGSPLILMPCDGGQAQQWQVASDGTIRTAGRCMDVAGAAKTVGTVVQLATCNGNQAQQFTFAGPELVSKLTGNCVDASGGQVTAGTGAVIQTCAVARARAWKQLP
jgi:hypothetical protein